MRFAEIATTAALVAALALAPAAAVADTPALPAPSLSVDQAFSPPSGIARDGGSGTDIPGGVAVDGDRIYVVGEAATTATTSSTSDSSVTIIARHVNGTYDTGFGSNGRVDINLANGKDTGAAVVVLPDHRIRILAATDVNSGSASSFDVAVIGLNADGSDDASFGTNGRLVFPVAPANLDDSPSRMIADATGKLAITGWSKDANGKEDSFVAEVTPAGQLDPTWDGDGVLTVNRGGGTLNDRGIDLAWRPGGGVLVLQQVATDPDTNVNKFVSVLHAYTPAGADDPTFSDDGDLQLDVGEPNTIPGGLLAYNGRYYVTGSTKVGTDTDSYLARVEGDGSAPAYRRFDMRGTQIDPSTVLVSGGGDLDVLPGADPTLVVVGSTTYNSRTYWSAAAFNAFETGDLAGAGFGDVLIPTDEYGALLGVAAGDGFLASTGSLLNVNGNFDTTFGTIKLLVDAEKTCDLSLEVPQPLEAVFTGSGAQPVTLKVTNKGTKTCAGTLKADPPFALARGGVFGPLPTDPLRPTAAFSTDGAMLSYDGPRVRESDVSLSVTSASKDADPTNNTTRLHVRFMFCDAALSFAGGRVILPSEGARSFDFDVRNTGTADCRRVHVALAGGAAAAGRPDSYAVEAGRSATDSVAARLTGSPKPGTKATIRFRAVADGDAQAANDTASVTGTVAGVGDSDITRAGARSIAGRAKSGTRPLSAAQRRVASVRVAVQQLRGKRCASLASVRTGRFRALSCSRRIWLRASGTRSWRLRLAHALPPGRYVVLSRAVLHAGFSEARFSARDHNKIALSVR